MNAIPPSMTPDHCARHPLGQTEASASMGKWAAVHEAAEVVATLAGLEREHTSEETGSLPAIMRETPAWRREFAECAIDDLAAIMEAGIAALLGVSDRGADPRPAARALWREFAAARSAILAVVSLGEPLEPRRRA